MKFLSTFLGLLSLSTAVKIPLHKKASSGQIQGGSVSLQLTNYDDQQYYAEFSIGTPPQKFKVEFSPTYGGLWVPATDCDTCGNHSRFDNSSSTTFVGLDTEMEGDDAIGKYKGRLAQDVVEIGGIQIQNQTFGAIYSMIDKNFNTFKADGIFGFSPEPNDDGTMSPFLTMVKQGLLEKNMFSFYIGRDGDDGELTLGGMNSDHYTGNITWVPANSSSWSVKLDNVIMETTDGRMALETCLPAAKTGCQMVLEPATSLNYLPVEDARALNGFMGATLVNGTYPELYTIPCDKVDSLPILFLVIGGQTFSALPSDYIMKAGKVCLSKLWGMDIDPETPIWLVGNTLGRSYYSIFDMDNKQLGLAYAMY